VGRYRDNFEKGDRLNKKKNTNNSSEDDEELRMAIKIVVTINICILL